MMERLAHDGVSLCFQDRGKGAPPVLLIHDLGSDHTSLQPELERFRHRHRVVAVDLPGHGRSDSLPGPYTVARFAEDLAWLCYELGLYRPIAVGKGIGGAIAIELASRCPDLLAAVVVLRSAVVPPAETPTRPHLAATWEKALAWDGAAGVAACSIPLLYIEADRPGADPNKPHAMWPNIVGVSMESRRPRKVEGEDQVKGVMSVVFQLRPRT